MTKSGCFQPLDTDEGVKGCMNQPAIILITCDELKKDTLSCYGNRAIETTHIDSLLNRGTDYQNCYTSSPWCLPARCSILTGLYPHNSGAYSNFRKCPLDNGLPNLFTELKRNGYETSLFGKCHFAPVPYDETRADVTLPYDDFKAYYESLGIDRLVLEDDKQVSVWFYDDYSKEMEKRGFLKSYRDYVWDRSKQKVFRFPGPAEVHPDAWVGQKAVDYLNRCTADGKPQFVWVSFSGPHYPFDAPANYWDQVDCTQLTPMKRRKDELKGEDRIHHKNYYGGGNMDGCHTADHGGCGYYSEEYWENLRISYNANMKLIDDQVGHILRAIKAVYGDNALIIFTADHGEMLGNHGLWGKHNCAYEEVWHIPMIVQFPRQSVAETRKEFVNSTDICPTCVSLAGGDFAFCDGYSLTDREKLKERRYTFAEGEGYLAVTDGTYKYIHVQKTGEEYQEFLDLQKDPDEFENRIEFPESQEPLARLRGKLLEHIVPMVLP